jgi:hypothetical protein
VDRRFGGGKSRRFAVLGIAAWARIRPTLLGRSPSPFACPPSRTQTTRHMNCTRSHPDSSLACARFVPSHARFVPSHARFVTFSGIPIGAEPKRCRLTNGV